MPTLADASTGTTRQELRRQVSDLLGDLVIATATATGSTTTFIDVDRLCGPVNAFAGREAYVAGGTAANLGKKRYVTASTTTGQLTFAALPSATAVGDEIELRNLRNQGWGVDEIHRALNMAIADASASFWSPAQETLAAFTAAGMAATAFSASSPFLTIPNAWSHVYAVEYQDSRGYWHEIQPANSDDVPGWHVVRGQRRLDINGRVWRDGANGAAIRISGYKRLGPLGSDSDATTINAEWLRHQAAAYLLLQGRERDGSGGRGQLYMQYQARADRLRDLVSGVPANNTAAVL